MIEVSVIVSIFLKWISSVSYSVICKGFGVSGISTAMLLSHMSFSSIFLNWTSELSPFLKSLASDKIGKQFQCKKLRV